MRYWLGVGLGLAVIAMGISLLCNPDPRYANIPAYQESSGSGAAILVIIGIALVIAAGDRA